MRLGQAACEMVNGLPTDSETQLALVPLTDSEYIRALEIADAAMVGDNPAGFAVRDELQKQSVIFFAAREINNLESKFFDDISEAGELGAGDVDFLYDVYLEMVANQSPSLFGISDEDFEALKKVWSLIEWSELSGQQWYAAQRFVNSIRPLLLQGNSSGSQPTSSLTQSSEKKAPAENAE